MRALLRAVALAGAVAGCAAATPAPVAVARPVAPDVHGEPLALLPPGAVAWGRVDLARLRSSPHFDAALALATEQGDLATLHRELGFDAVREADVLAVAVYLPPGREGAGWPLVYARGRVRRDAILAAARARSTDGAAPAEETAHGVRYWVAGARAYVFPADDVALVMDRALARRVAERLTGRIAQSVLDDDRFAPLWEEAGGTEGAALVAADLAALRGRARAPRRGPEASLETVVARGDAPGEVLVHAAGRCRDDAGAQALVRALDDTRRDLGRRLEVRLLGLARLANEGVRASARGALVRVEARATAAEAGRLLRAATLVNELSGQ